MLLKPNNYSKAMDQIETPPALKEETRQMLIEQMQTQAQPLVQAQIQPNEHAKVRKAKISYLPLGFSAVAAVLVLIIGLSILMRTEDVLMEDVLSEDVLSEDALSEDVLSEAALSEDVLPEDVLTQESLIVTELSQYEHTDVVVLQDGELYFETFVAGDLQMPIRFAPGIVLRRNMSFEEYEHLLPAEIPDVLSPPYGEITAYFESPTADPVAVLGRIYYYADSGGVLMVIFSNDSSMLHTPIEADGSKIAGVPVGVGFYEADGRYYGVYERDEFTFLLIAEGMEQRQFIYLLVHFVTS